MLPTRKISELRQSYFNMRGMFQGLRTNHHPKVKRMLGRNGLVWLKMKDELLYKDEEFGTLVILLMWTKCYFLVVFFFCFIGAHSKYEKEDVKQDVQLMFVVIFVIMSCIIKFICFDQNISKREIDSFLVLGLALTLVKKYSSTMINRMYYLG